MKYIERDKLPIRMRLEDGVVLATEVNSNPRAFAVSGVLAALNCYYYLGLPLGGGYGLIVGHSSAYISDISLLVRNRNRPPPGQGSDKDGRAFPPLVGEIEISQSALSLSQRVNMYFSPRTTIRMYFFYQTL